MLENISTIKKRKKNMKLYPTYRMFATDCVFLYAIKFLFLTQIKGISASDIILSVSLFAFFMVILQIPATIIVDRIGYKKAAIVSNFSNALYVLILIFSTNLVWLICAEFISAITFSIKEIADPCILESSIPMTIRKRHIFSKIEGKGVANYYILDATTAILAGFIYAVNPYFPLICSIVISLIACLLNLQFEEIDIKNNKKKENSSSEIMKEYISDLKVSFKFIIRSKRLRGLIIYSGIIWGFHCLFSEYKTSMLADIGVTSKIMGIISSMLCIVGAVGSRKQIAIHNKFKNKSLSVIGIVSMSAMLISGLIVIFNAPFIIATIVIVLCAIASCTDRAIYDVLIKRYLGNFANKKILPKIYSANSLGKNIVRMIVGITGSIVIKINGSAKATVIMGMVFCVFMILILMYMKTRVGLKPEEYKKEEIQYNN